MKWHRKRRVSLPGQSGRPLLPPGQGPHSAGSRRGQPLRLASVSRKRLSVSQLVLSDVLSRACLGKIICVECKHGSEKGGFLTFCSVRRSQRSNASVSTKRRNVSSSKGSPQSISGQRSISSEPSVMCTAAMPPRHSVQKLWPQAIRVNCVPATKKASLFWSFPYVCPEPVLVKSSFLV